MQEHSLKTGGFFVGVVLFLALPVITFANALSTTAGGSGPDGSCSNTGTGHAACSASFSGITMMIVPYSATLTADATASYGSLFAHAEITSTADIAFNVQASASFSDTLTVTGFAGNGHIDYIFDGTFTGISDFGQVFDFQQGAFAPVGFNSGNFNQVNVPFQFQTPAYPFTFGSPFTIQASVNATAVGLDDQFGKGIFDVSLRQIDVSDQNFTPLESFSVSAQSGAQYPTPEPSSLLLLATLAALLGGLIYKAGTYRLPQ